MADQGPWKGGTSQSRLARLLAELGTFCSRRASGVALASLGLFGLSLLAILTRLHFAPDRNALLGPTDPLRRSQAAFEREFPAPPDLVVLVEGGSAGERQALVRRLGRLLEAEPRVFRDVFWGLDLPVLRRSALYYLEPARLQDLEGDLAALLPALEVLGDADHFATLLDGCRTRLLGEDPRTLELVNRLFNQLVLSLANRGNFQFQAPWRDWMPPLESPTRMGTLDPETFAFYPTRDGGRKHLVLVRPASGDWAGTRAAVLRLRALLAGLAHQASPLRLRLTGESVIAVDEMDTVRRDAARSALLALVAVALLVALCFGEVRRPLVTMAAVIVGVGWALGFAAVAVGPLNLVTAWVATLLVVLTSDMGIHLVYRYEEECCGGRGAEGALRIAMATAGRENLVSALTTAATFYALLLTDFQGLHELALLAGTGTALGFLATSTALPAFLALHERRGRPSRLRHHENQDLIRVEDACLRVPGLVGAAFAVAFLGLVPTLDRVPVGCSLLDLQDPALEAVQTARELERERGDSVMVALALAPSLATAGEVAARFEALPTVDHVESLAPMIPRGAAEKSARIRALRARVDPVRTPTLPTARGRIDLERTAEALADLERTLDTLEPERLRSPAPAVRQGFLRLRATFRQLRQALDELGPGTIEDALESFRRQLLEEVHQALDLLKAQDPDHPLALEDLPPSLRDRGVGRTGAVLLRVVPREDLGDPAELERFVAEVRQVDPDAVGPAVALHHFTRGLTEAYRQASAAGLWTLGLVVLLHLRSLPRALLALLPLVLGVTGMLGTLSVLGQPLDVVNFLALPLLMALGSALGVHVLDRYVDYGGEGLFRVSTGPATALSALTTLCGFGTLATARHAGMAGLGLAMVGGLATATLAALFLLPALVKLLRRSGFRV